MYILYTLKRGEMLVLKYSKVNIATLLLLSNTVDLHQPVLMMYVLINFHKCATFTVM